MIACFLAALFVFSSGRVAATFTNSSLSSQNFSSFAAGGHYASGAPKERCSPGPWLRQHQRSQGGGPFVPFLILTEAHSGSTWVRTMLNAHPCIRSHGESLRHPGPLHDLWQLFASPTNTDQGFCAAKSNCNKRKAPPAVPLFAAGCKAFFTKGENSIQNAKVYTLIRDFFKSVPSAAIIFLKRNPLDRFISFEREHRIHAPHCNAKSNCNINEVHRMTFNLPTKNLLAFLDTADANEKLALAMLRDFGSPVLEVAYEELVGEHARERWGSILEFLHIAPSDVQLLQSDFQRQITKTHNRTIQNYQQVQQALRQHRQGKFTELL